MKSKSILAFAVLVTVAKPFAFAAPPAPVPPNPMRQHVAARVAELRPWLEPLYRHFHAHPELSLQETNTSERLADELQRIGYSVTRRVGGLGIVGVLSNGNGPTVLVRTDMDALPIVEQTGAAYASVVKTLDEQGATTGVMHACGHDVHMTAFLGAARVLGELKDHWRGTLVMVGQPAEERVLGAKAMLADGLFTRFPKPDYCLALHCAADLPAGTVGITEGYAMANSDAVDLVIRGVSGHGAWPHKTKDPVVLAAQTVLALQTIVSRETDPTQPAVVTVGSIHGGTKHNIIPDEVRLQLTVRSYSDEVRQHALAAIARIARGLAEAAGIPDDRAPIITVTEGVPATYNHPELAQRLKRVFKDWFGDDHTTGGQPAMGAEDFGLFSGPERRIPSCMFRLGAVDPGQFKAHQESGKPLPTLHSSQFLPAFAPAIQAGVTAMTAAVLELLP